MWIATIVACQKERQKMEEVNKNPASNEGTPAPQNPSEEQGKQTQAPTGAVEGTPNEGQQNVTPNEEQPKGTETKAPEAQSKEENAKFAAMRHAKEVEKAKAAGDAEGYKRARIKSVGGKNPYAGDSPIETDEDYELYELQDEVKQKGGDPSNILEVDKLRREKMAEAARAAEDAKSDEEKRQEKANNEVAEYLKEGHTQQELQALWADKKFQEFAGDMLGLVPLKSIIDKFNKAYPKENPEVKKNAANNMSSPGSATNGGGETPKKEVKDMNTKEFAKFFEEVKSGKRKLA